MLMRPKHPRDRQLTLKASGVHDLLDGLTAQPTGEMRHEGCDIRRATHSRGFYHFVTASRASKVAAALLSQGLDDYRHLIEERFPNCGLLL